MTVLSRKIPQALHGAVLARLQALDPSTGKPFTSREVARWLREEHGVECGRMAVLRLQDSLDAQGEARVVAALREELRDAVAPAKRRLVEASRQLAEMLLMEKNTQKVAAGVRALTSALNALATLGGVASPLKVDVTSDGKPLDARERLAASLARLAEEPGPGGSGTADRGPSA